MTHTFKTRVLFMGLKQIQIIVGHTDIFEGNG